MDGLVPLATLADVNPDLPHVRDSVMRMMEKQAELIGED